MRKVDKHAVAKALDKPSAVSRQDRAINVVNHRPPTRYRVFLVILHKPHGVGHVHDKHRPDRAYGMASAWEVLGHALDCLGQDQF